MINTTTSSCAPNVVKAPWFFLLLLAMSQSTNHAISTKPTTQTVGGVSSHLKGEVFEESIQVHLEVLGEKKRQTNDHAPCRKLLSSKDSPGSETSTIIQGTEGTRPSSGGSIKRTLEYPPWMDGTEAYHSSKIKILEVSPCSLNETAQPDDGTANYDGRENLQSGSPNAGRLLLESDEEAVPQGCKIRLVRKQMVREKLLVLREKWKHGKIKVYVQHMNKGGGTTLCDFFGRSALRVPRKSNCNGDPSFALYTRGDAFHVKELYETMPYQVFFNEGPMFQQPLDTRHFVFVTSIRKPEYRVVSQLLHHWEGRYHFFPNQTVNGLGTLLERYINHRFLEGKPSIYTQNMQTVQLLGEGKPDNFSAAYNQAISRLFEFAITIPTDKMKEGLENLGKLFYPSMPRVQQNDQKNVHNAAQQIESLLHDSPEILAYLKEQNLYDQCLYHQANALHRVQTEVLRELSFD
mmetsp:Transcript_3902/g.24688  ORF Transcript_3902/g.24688 Transcript_3902/m.24688 type:complete len:463 (-) Transcript_3902:1116-2504(-)|eukprot:CAMPEP_0183829268 /NCGR_PEP_ID=MMETSP0807_2-20130328/3217_1 /TAXON_ID=88271 /ORGANISM="Picocystis salinarum, Strain CCMP1897" /LENGTH=462 /DNA_ID=CAMNT_0026074475 /DNA_START=386 /DNA_END=1774 /DNA_ORIENTATION=+